MKDDSNRSKYYQDRYDVHRRMLEEFTFSGNLIALRKIFLALAADLYQAARFVSKNQKTRLVGRADYYFKIGKELEKAEERLQNTPVIFDASSDIPPASA